MVLYLAVLPQLSRQKNQVCFFQGCGRVVTLHGTFSSIFSNGETTFL